MCDGVGWGVTRHLLGGQQQVHGAGALRTRLATGSVCCIVFWCARYAVIAFSKGQQKAVRYSQQRQQVAAHMLYLCAQLGPEVVSMKQQ